MVNLRKAQKEQTRNNILNVAVELFQNSGYEKATMRQIAKASNISPGTIFVHFKNKHDLLVNILYEKIEAMLAKAYKGLDYNDSLKDQLLYLSTQAYKFYFKDPDLSRALFKEALFQVSIDGEEDILDTQIQNYIISLLPLFEEAKKRKEIEKDTDVIGVCRLYFSAYFAVLMKSLKQARPKVSEASDNLDLALVQIFSGIKPR